MPKKFDACRRAGGRIRTIVPKKGRYQHICIRPKGRTGPRGGRAVGGEVKAKKP